MKSFSAIACTAVLLAAGLFTNASAQQTTATPEWVKITEKIEWGTVGVPTSGSLEEKLIITNTGKSVVKIVDVKPGCGCTKTEPDKLELNPGEKSTVTIKLNISPTQMGEVTKSVTVRAAQGTDTVTKVVMLHANIERLLKISPNQYISLSDLAIGKKSVSKITITSSSTKPITITGITTNGNLVAYIDNNTVIKPGQTMEIDLALTPKNAGQQNGTFTFKASDGTKTEEFAISAYGNVAQ